MSSRVRDYDYELPPELIAQRPLELRDASRMMVLRREAQSIEHRYFRELPALLSPGDLLVLNDSRVVAARRFSDDGEIEFLFTEQLSDRSWRALVKPGRKMRIGHHAILSGTRAEVVAIREDGDRELVFEREINVHEGGAMPLPPYIERMADAEDSERYQTVFARAPGSVAAPTAGLHFTPELLAKIPHATITLHVGTGTFRPVKVEDATQHPMHAERFTITAAAAAAIDSASRVVAVGTTSVRVLESAATREGQVIPQSGSTDIFIRPPFDFRVVDLLLTNFHLPRSTLLMLVSAFAGREFALRAYAEAVRERYRFFSYGDCMLIL